MMEKGLLFLTILLLLFITGCCSIPRIVTYGELQSFTREKKKSKASLAFLGANEVLVNDFRERKAGEEDIKNLKSKVESYISSRPGLSESAKNNLQELKVTSSSTKEEVELLLGRPDKVINKNEKNMPGSEAWVYLTNRQSVFSVVFLPVFFDHEKYYLYFKDGLLASIERHYLEQTFTTGEPQKPAVK